MSAAAKLPDEELPYFGTEAPYWDEIASAAVTARIYAGMVQRFAEVEDFAGAVYATRTLRAALETLIRNEHDLGNLRQTGRIP